MIRDIKDYKIRKIYVWKGDRLTRKFIENEDLQQLFIKYEVDLVSLTEDINFKTADGRSIERKRAVERQAESEKTSERTKMGLQSSAFSGNYPKSKPKLGYKWLYDTHPSPIVIDDEASKFVIELVDKLIIEKIGVPSLVHWMNVTNFMGRKWHTTTLYYLLRDPILCGTFVDNVHAPTLTIENHTKGILTEERFNELQDCLNGRSKDKRHYYLFKQFVYCEHCSKLMVAQPTIKSNGTVYKYYICTECNRRINENVILAKLVEDLDAITLTLSDQLLLDKLKGNRNKLLDIVKKNDNLYYENYINKSEYDKIVMDVCDSLSTANNLIKNFTKNQTIRFSKLSNMDKRIFVREHIENITINFVEDRVVLKLKDKNL